MPLGGGGGGERVFVELSELSVSERDGGGEGREISGVGRGVLGVAIVRGVFATAVLCGFDSALLAGGGGAFRPELDLLREPLIAGMDNAVLLVESFLDSGGEGGSGFLGVVCDITFADVGDFSSTKGEGKGG